MLCTKLNFFSVLTVGLTLTHKFGRNESGNGTRAVCLTAVGLAAKGNKTKEILLRLKAEETILTIKM